MDRVEETLRRTFRERAATPPAVEDLADRAIGGARRARRNRTAFASLAAALSVALVAFGVAMHAGPGPGGVGPGPAGTTETSPTPAPLASPPPVDVVLDDRLLLADGGEIPLAELGCDSCWISGAWRVPDGFLVAVYGSATGRGSLWHVPESGPPTVVVVGDGDGDVLVSAGTPHLPGVRVAWSADGRLHLGAYASGVVTETASVPDPGRADSSDARPLHPQAVVGDAVVLAGTQTGGGLDIWALWFPDRADYVPSPYGVIAIHAVTLDRERLIAWYRETGSRQGCLGELDPDESRPVRSRCPSPFWDYDRILPSPDGRWWIVAGVDGWALYDAEQVWLGAEAVRTWPAIAAPIGTAWLDDTSFVVLERSVATIRHTDGRPDEQVPMHIPDDVTRAGIVVDLR